MFGFQERETMKKHLTIFSLIISFAMITISCEKKSIEPEEDSPHTDNTGATNYPTEQTDFNTALYNDASKTWGNGVFKVLGIGVEDCRYDDQMSLKSDGTYSYNNGSNLCGGDLQTKNGAWEANFTARTITFDKGTSDENVATIKTLDNFSMTVEGTWLNMNLSGAYIAL